MTFQCHSVTVAWDGTEVVSCGFPPVPGAGSRGHAGKLE